MLPYGSKGCIFLVFGSMGIWKYRKAIEETIELVSASLSSIWSMKGSGKWSFRVDGSTIENLLLGEVCPLRVIISWIKFELKLESSLSKEKSRILRKGKVTVRMELPVGEKSRDELVHKLEVHRGLDPTSTTLNLQEIGTFPPLHRRLQRYRLVQRLNGPLTQASCKSGLVREEREFSDGNMSIRLMLAPRSAKALQVLSQKSHMNEKIGPGSPVS
ncbi:hypothetical protein Tco_1175544 [Tanacetum coccineum]